MFKKIFGGAVAIAIALPVMASAATISSPLFSNGDTVIDAGGGSTVNGTFTLQVGSSEVCEVVRTQADTQAFTDTSVGSNLGYQFGTYTNVPFNVKVSPNTGTYNATVQCAGIFGGNRSVDGADGVVVGPVSLGTVRVVANSTNSSNPAGTSQWDALMAAIQLLIAKLSAPPAPPAPVVPAVKPVCTQLAQYSYLQVGATGATVSALQGVLLGNGGAIPALTSGAATYGYFGQQTNAALYQVKALNQCV